MVDTVLFNNMGVWRWTWSSVTCSHGEYQKRLPSSYYMCFVIFELVVEPTHLKNMLAELDHVPGKNIKPLKPPTSFRVVSISPSFQNKSSCKGQGLPCHPHVTFGDFI